MKFARVDSDTMKSARDYEATLESFAKGEIQVMLGTQMIAKGLDYPNVTLVGVISGDTALSLPDFRAAERTFQLITQVAGRAGRGDAPGRVVLQTFMPDDPTILMAIKQDYLTFAQRELAARKEIGLPPAARMVRIILRDEEEAKLHERCQTLAAGLTSAIGLQSGAPVTMKGPMPCPINRIAGYHRHQVLLYSASATALQKVLALAREQKAFANPEKIAVDVDPVSLL
jgi:primosomal protein N' (replication factor Y)